MNFTVNGKILLGGAGAWAVPADIPARAWLLRRQERVRPGRLRRLHGLARRRALPFLPRARLSRRRARDHHHRGARARRQAAPDAAGLSRCAGLSMRLLRRRHDHDRGDLRQDRARGSAAYAEGQSLPLHRLSQHRRCAARRRQCRGGVAGDEACGRSLRNPFAESIVTGKARYTLDVPAEGALHLKVLRSPHAHARIKSIKRDKAHGRARRRRRVHLGGRAAQALLHGDARGSSGRSGRHLHPRQCRALRRPAGRGRASPRPRPPRKKPAGCSRSSTSCCPPVFDPELAMEPGAPILHEKSVAFSDNVYVDIHGELGSVEQGFKEADAIHEMTYSTSRVQHVHLETHGSLAWRGEDGRLHVRTSSQAPFIAKQKLCYLFGLYDRDVHVFTERIGGGFGGKQEMISEDLCALATLKIGRPVMWEFTRAGAVHRRHHAPPDDHACEARRQEGRHADRAPGPRRVQHRRLWRPWRRDAGGGARQPDRRLSLRQQEGRRLRRLYQHGAGRRISRLRRLADHLRHRMRHGRSREAAGLEPLRDQAHQQGPGDRPDRVDLEGPVRRRVRQLRHRPMSRSRRDGAEKRPGPAQARRRRVAGGHRRRARHARFRPADRAPLGRRDAASCPTAAIISRSARPRWATARPRRTARLPPRCSARARATSPSSTATPTRRPTTPAPSPAPGRSSPARRWRRPLSRSATCSSPSPAVISAASRPIAGCRTTRSSAPTRR